MKKFALVLGMISVFFIANTAMATDVFDSLEDINPAQKAQISKVQNLYKIQNNELEMRISSYTDKIAKLKNDKDKTQDQISLLTGAYERNIATLKNQQEILARETDAQYKKILTEKQYKQYQALQLNVQNAFNNFLDK